PISPFERDPGAGRRGPLQRRDRQAVVHQREDRLGPRLQHPRQAGRRWAHRGGRDRAAARPDRLSGAAARSGSQRLIWGWPGVTAALTHVGPGTTMSGREAHMGKLIYSAITSLDGYVADADGGFEWAAPDEEVHAFVNELQRPVGTQLL